MDIALRAARAVSLAVKASLLLIFGSEMANTQAMTGGTLVNASMGGFGWGWLPALLAIVLLVVSVSVIAGRK